MNEGFTKGFDTGLVRLHSSPSYGFLSLKQNVALNSRVLNSSSAYGAHLVASAIQVRSSPVKSPLFNALRPQDMFSLLTIDPIRLAAHHSENPMSSITTYLDFYIKEAESAIVSSNNDVCYSIAIVKKPLLPGFYTSINVKDPNILAALRESQKSEAPYAGAFLLKSEGSSSSGTWSRKDIVEKWDSNGKSKRTKEELLKLIHEVGTLVVEISLSDQGDIVHIFGLRRLRITELVSEEPLTLRVELLKDKPYDKDGDVIKATRFKVNSMLSDDVLKTTFRWSGQVYTHGQPIGDFNYQHLADFGAGISRADRDKLQEVLEELDVPKRLELTLELVEKQKELKKIQDLRVETDDKKNKKYKKSSPHKKFRERINANKDKIPNHVLEVIEDEIRKLKMLCKNSNSFADASNYLDWLTLLPWGTFSDDNFDVQRAEKILEEDHYGLSDVKERILEFIAVGKLRGTSQGKIICLYGPPGVGKTSIACSIARALDRKFFRFSVGGLSDVEEIKGSRRLWVGAAPGKMVQCLKSVGTSNPLVLIDEIDKIGSGNSGNPASALLEVMDPAQNANFLDFYLDVTIDLSKVLFVCTANEIDEISAPLLDRMEVITLPGYVTDEKMHIARDYLETAVCRDCGIKPQQTVLSDAALLALIENYCREAGVRNLNKHIEKIYRKIALKLVRERASTEEPAVSDGVDDILPPLAKNGLEFKRMKLLESETQDSSTESKTKPSGAVAQTGVVAKTVVIDESNLADYVGKPVFSSEKIYKQTPAGVVMGLAWTSLGGSILYIETTFVEEGKGKGDLRTSGRLGDVMKESAKIAHIVARRIMLEKEPENPFFANSKLHLHVPKGATPKDGPSTGCAMITSLLSLAMKKPVRKDLAMTGEVTLTGKILPIGGVVEKTMAAVRNQVKTIIFPKGNEASFDELTEDLKQGLDVHFVDEYEEIFDIAFNYEHKKKSDKLLPKFLRFIFPTLSG